MNRLSIYFQLLRNMGFKYIIFRFQYELTRKSGWMKRRYPVSSEEIKYLSLANWQKNIVPFFFMERKDVKVFGTETLSQRDNLERIVKGEYCFFSSVWYKLGNAYDWGTNPDTGYQYCMSEHWTAIEDIVQTAGDIKYVWEPSRFSFLYDIIRHDHKTGECHASLVFERITDWIDKNPLNCGPNYKCSQEISIRVLNWIFALYYYRGTDELTENTFDLIIRSIHGQIKHVYSNIHFSKIAVRNNHAITETLTLYLVGLIFPQFPEAEKWKRKGKKWFEEEIIYQIADDGTYLQFSMNYHRVVIQLLTWAIAIADKNGETFCEKVYDCAYKSVNFLYQCQDDLTGYLPNYGSNDGALFFKLNDSDYRDYRPQLDVLHYLLTLGNLYTTEYEDRYWYVCNENVKRKLYPIIKKQFGCVSFKKGGYYLIRERDSFSFIRCGKYKSRPAHADNLHIDIWYKGENILMDSGSYKYNTKPSLIKYFAGTESHNTVMLDDKDQVLKGPKFILYYWSQATDASLRESDENYSFTGTISCFGYLSKRIMHVRKVVKIKDKSEWIIEDRIVNKPKGMNMRQLWHTLSSNINFESVNGVCLRSKGSFSTYYGTKAENTQIEFVTTSDTIKTKIQIS